MNSEPAYQLLFDQNPNAVFSLDLEGNITLMNKQLPILLECPESKLKGESIFPFMLPAANFSMPRNIHRKSDYFDNK